MICKFGYQIGTDFNKFGNCLLCSNDNYSEWISCKVIYKSCSSKVPYKSETMAKIEANKYNLSSVYKCHFCNMWHISS